MRGRISTSRYSWLSRTLLATIGCLPLAACGAAPGTEDIAADAAHSVNETGDGSETIGSAANALSGTTQINGLTVIVNFTDFPFNASAADVTAMLNQPTGFNKWGNVGSVNQYYTNQTAGHVTLNNQVVSISLNHTWSYYGQSTTFDGGQELTKDTIAALNQAYPNGFSGLSKAPNDNRLWSFMILMDAPGDGGASFGLNDPTLAIKNDGVMLPVQTVAQVQYGGGRLPQIVTPAHELGHHLFSWTDYYYASPTWSNIGHYALMSSGGTQTTPMPMDIALRYKQGWIDNIVDLAGASSTQYTVTANSRTRAFKYANPNNPQEYYLIEALVHDQYYAAIDGENLPTDEGLAIWYVDEGFAPMGPYPRVRLVQADGHDDMVDATKDHTTLRGDLTDMFDNVSNKFSGALYPDFAWKDGSQPALVISNISAPGATMTFTASTTSGVCSSSQLAPAGSSSSTNENASFLPSYAVDGNGQTRWSSSFADNQWLTVDLGTNRYIDKLELVWEAASAADYRVEISTNGTTWTTAKTFTGGTGARTDVLSGLSAHVGRYVRMFGTKRSTPYGFSLWEMRVFGDNNPSCGGTPQVCTDVALPRASASATSVELSYTPAQAIDAQIQPTRWGSAFAGLSDASADAQSITVDLGATRYVGRVALTWEAASAAAYAIDLSTDGVNFTTAKTVAGGAAGARIDTLTGLSSHVARYVRMRGIDRATVWGYSLYDFAVYGDTNSTCVP